MVPRWYTKNAVELAAPKPAFLSHWCATASAHAVHDMSNASKADVSKAKPVEDFVTAQHGSGPFRAFNFELYAVRDSAQLPEASLS